MFNNKCTHLESNKTFFSNKISSIINNRINNLAETCSYCKKKLNHSKLLFCVFCQDIFCSSHCSSIHYNNNFSHFLFFCITKPSSYVKCFKCDCITLEPALRILKQYKETNDYSKLLHYNNNSNWILDLFFGLNSFYSLFSIPSYNSCFGFYNSGNTCYFNAVVQSLVHSPSLIRVFLNANNPFHISNNNDLSFTYIFQELINLVWSKKNSHQSGQALNILSLHSSMCKNFDAFVAFQQQDAHEALRLITSLFPSNLMDDIFQGSIISKTQCVKCKHFSTKEEKYLDLSLEIPSSETKNSGWLGGLIGSNPNQTSLEKCLNSFFSLTETETKNSNYKCEGCKLNHNILMKQLFLKKAPEILVIHLKRFHYGSYYSSKVSDKVVFPFVLDLSPYCESIPQDVNLLQSFRYDLYAIISHNGGISSGHYITYCKGIKSWFVYNDSNVHEVSIEKLQNVEAYLLFYTRHPIQPLLSDQLNTILNNSSSPNNSNEVVPIPVNWLQKFTYLIYPGEIEMTSLDKKECAFVSKECFENLVSISHKNTENISISPLYSVEEEAEIISAAERIDNKIGYYAIPSVWLDYYRKYLTKQVTSRPTVIDTTILTDMISNNHSAYIVTDYRLISSTLWNILIKIYGLKGPELFQDHYSTIITK